MSDEKASLVHNVREDYLPYRGKRRCLGRESIGSSLGHKL